MQIKVEIEVKPEELRRFLGLPDVSGLQDDVMNFVREKMGQASEGIVSPAAEFVREKMEQASEGLSPAAEFVRENLGNLKDTGAATLQKLITSVKVRLTEHEPPAPMPAEPPPPPVRKRKSTAGKPRKRAAPKKAV